MRLVDADVLREEVYSWGMNDYEPSDFTDAIDDAPTVEAIPKADYKARLKADMVSMLTEIQLEFNKAEMHRYDDEIDIAYNTGLHRCGVIIQDKISALKGEETDGKR